MPLPRRLLNECCRTGNEPCGVDLYIYCLRNARRATLSINGEQTVGVVEFDDGTEGLIRKTTITEGPLSQIDAVTFPKQPSALRTATSW